MLASLAPTRMELHSRRNDTKRNYVQHNDTHHNDIQQSNKKHDIQHFGTYYRLLLWSVLFMLSYGYAECRKQTHYAECRYGCVVAPHSKPCPQILDLGGYGIHYFRKNNYSWGPDEKCHWLLSIVTQYGLLEIHHQSVASLVQYNKTF